MVTAGLTAAVSGLVTATTGVPPFILYVKGEVPVKVIKRFVLVPLHIVASPLITAVGSSLTFNCTALDALKQVPPTLLTSQ